MCCVAKMDMELLAEFTASRSPNYKHGTPDGVQHSKRPNSNPNPYLVRSVGSSNGFVLNAKRSNSTGAFDEFSNCRC